MVLCGSDRRHGERLKTCCRMQIVAPGNDVRPAEALALSVDISEGGACANTAKALAPGELVEVVLDTAEAAQYLGIPPTLRGHAEVKRVDAQAGGWRKVALSFAPALAESLEMALFLAFLYGQQQPMQSAAGA